MNADPKGRGAMLVSPENLARALHLPADCVIREVWRDALRDEIHLVVEGPGLPPFVPPIPARRVTLEVTEHRTADGFLVEVTSRWV